MRDYFTKEIIPLKYFPRYHKVICKGPTGKSPGVPPSHNALDRAKNTMFIFSNRRLDQDHRIISLPPFHVFRKRLIRILGLNEPRATKIIICISFIWIIIFKETGTKITAKNKKETRRECIYLESDMRSKPRGNYPKLS